MLAIAAGLLVGVVCVQAESEYNRKVLYEFSSNQQKKVSADTVKPADGERNFYVTTKPSDSNGIASTVFPNGGKFYARSRWGMNPSLSYSSLLTFTSNDKKSAPYETKTIYFGDNYRLWAEIDNTVFTGPYRYQAVVWCP